MDIDSALNELGMLSTVTNSRRQYLAEVSMKQRKAKPRERTSSEPSVLPSTSSDATGAGTVSDQKPTQSSLDVLQLNTQYCTGVYSSSRRNLRRCKTLGSERDHEKQQQQHNFNTTISKHARRHSWKSKSRFQKPYAIPWLIHKTPHMEAEPVIASPAPVVDSSTSHLSAAMLIDLCIESHVKGEATTKTIHDSINQLQDKPSQSLDANTDTIKILSSPKTAKTLNFPVQRSRSLDDVTCSRGELSTSEHSGSMQAEMDKVERNMAMLKVSNHHHLE